MIIWKSCGSQLEVKGPIFSTPLAVKIGAPRLRRSFTKDFVMTSLMEVDGFLGCHHVFFPMNPDGTT
jgi:hypothetical protein